MAEAHSAVGFSFSVSEEGFNVSINYDAFRAIWSSGIRGWRKRLTHLRNSCVNGIYPFAPMTWFFSISLVEGVWITGFDPSYGCINWIGTHLPLPNPQSNIVAAGLFATGVFCSAAYLLKTVLRLLLSYQGWMFDPRGKMSWMTKFWYVGISMLTGRTPLLYSYQNSLPKLPVPSLQDTMTRYLRSVQPLLDDAQYRRMEGLVAEFSNGLGPKLQRYLVLKSWWATNYVSDWWEEYVYLRGRSPIMVNSNFYGIDCTRPIPTNVQAARAALVIWAMLQYRSRLDKEDVQPIMLNGVVPLCSHQYERQFNTTRVPGIETDKIVHLYDSNHIVVYHAGRYFKVYIRQMSAIMKPCQIEQALQMIIDNDTPPLPGEANLAALTAGDRVPWAKIRASHFNKGVNKISLAAVENAAFVVALDDEAHDYNYDNADALDAYARSMLHGKCYNRWFDKSFTLVVCSNGRVGFNAEHGWADAPIMGYLWETVMINEWEVGYTDSGHCHSDTDVLPPNPIRLQWELVDECRQVIDTSLKVAQLLASDVDLHLLKFTAFGKGFVKTCKLSPDAFVQAALQLAYFRDANRFCLTYEASMTRLFREGRTETVRSCTVESSAFVKSMCKVPQRVDECIAKLRISADKHQDMYRKAMTGNGIDRHLFCLYVVSRYLGQDSPFLKEVLSEPWRLSTSQTPHQQTDRRNMPAGAQNIISAGGGFGPVADDGYGVSYIIAGEDIIFFHISSKHSCPDTNSRRFGKNIVKALMDIQRLFN